SRAAARSTSRRRRSEAETVEPVRRLHAVGREEVTVTEVATPQRRHLERVAAHERGAVARVPPRVERGRRFSGAERRREPRRAGNGRRSGSAGPSSDGVAGRRAIVGEGRARRQGHGDHGAVAAARTAGQIDAREAAEERAPVLRRGRHGRGGEEAAGALAMSRRHAAGREEAEVADLDEADGEDVEEEAADEFVRRQAHRAPVLGGEAHARLVGGEQAVVREPDAMGIAAEVAEDLGGAGKRPLRVDDPVVAVELLLQVHEGPWVGERGAGAGEIESAARVLAGEGGHELPAEQPGGHAHGQEMGATAADAAGAGGREAAAGHEAVEVGMELEVTGPGVEDGGHAETGAETVRVEAEREERAGGRPEEEREQAPTVAEREGAELG